MSYGGFPYGGVGYAGSDPAQIPQGNTEPILAVEVAFTTGALEDPAWVDIAHDVRSWNVLRGRSRELERFQPGRATVVLSNLSRQYDSVYAEGPWYGHLKPNRRIRIRETFNGVTYPIFDGYIDRWVLDYPGVGHDATATIIATDAFKLFARTELPVSLYEKVVTEDAPLVWWKLSDSFGQAEDDHVALNSGTAGSSLDGTFVGVPRTGELGLITNDPSTSVSGASSEEEPNIPLMGVELDSAKLALLSTHASWALELWIRPEDTATVRRLWTSTVGTGLTTDFLVNTFTDATGRRFQVILQNQASTQFSIDSAAYPLGERYHVVVKRGPNGLLTLWVNGVQDADTDTSSGTFAAVDLLLAHHHNDTLFNLTGDYGHAAIYVAAAGVDPLPADRILAHYEAGTHPWQGDLPGERIHRVLDIVGFPEDLREVDAGVTELQSVSFQG